MIDNNYFERDWEWHKTLDKKCLAPWHSLTIDWAGNVYSDAVATKPYGNLYESTLEEMWNNDTAIGLRQSWADSSFDNPICRKCNKKNKPLIVLEDNIFTAISNQNKSNKQHIT